MGEGYLDEGIQENTMQLFMTLDSSVISFIVLALIYINAYNRSEKAFLHYKLFIALVQINMAMLVIDVLAWVFNGLPGAWNLHYNTIFNILLYVMEPVAPCIWIIYADFHIYQNEKRIRKTAFVLLGLLFINAIISITSILTGWFFYVDTRNIYHRGTFYMVHVVYCYMLLLYSLVLVILNRKLLEARHYGSMLLFFVPQLIGTTVQMFFYGVSTNWSGMMVSVLIIYFNIQNRGLNTDYLTGTYNRRQLDGYIKAKVRTSTEGRSFSAILLDLDKFKSINDSLGHEVGDMALKDAVKIIRKSLRPSDFLARYGGDEFVIIVNMNDRNILQQVVQRIQNNAEHFNQESQRPYKIGFSIGFDSYDPCSKKTPDEFLKHIDLLMYENKKAKAYSTLAQ